MANKPATANNNEESLVSDNDHSGDDDDDDDDDDDYDDKYCDEDESYESEESDGAGRTLLFLCEEGQLEQALKRVRAWDEARPVQASGAGQRALEVTIQREIFRRNPSTGNYCLHEILAGGSSEEAAPELTLRLLRRYARHKETLRQVVQVRTMLLATPRGSHGRTVMHWCAWSKTTPDILRRVAELCPDALCLRDDASHASRTPLEIAKRYWPNDETATILETSLARYLSYRLRICVKLCVARLFQLPRDLDAAKNGLETTPATLTPFDGEDRKRAGLTPRSWFVASVLGDALRREMRGVASRIVSFVGGSARADPKKKRRPPATKTTRPHPEAGGARGKKRRGGAGNSLTGVKQTRQRRGQVQRF